MRKLWSRDRPEDEFLRAQGEGDRLGLPRRQRDPLKAPKLFDRQRHDRARVRAGKVDAEIELDDLVPWPCAGIRHRDAGAGLACRRLAEAGVTVRLPYSKVV